MTFILANRQFEVSRADFEFAGPQRARGKVGLESGPSFINVVARSLE